MHDDRLPGLVEPVQVRHRRIEREEAVERQRRRLAVERERLVAAQLRPSPDRRPARRRRARRARRAARSPGSADRGLRRARASADAPRRTARRSQQQFAARWVREASWHHLRWNSGDISSSASACGRLSARAMVCARLGRGQRAERRRRPAPADRAVADALGELVGDVEPLRQPVEPGRFVVGEALRRRRPPQRLAQQRCAPAACARYRAARRRSSAQRRHDPFARPLELGARGVPGFRRA